MSDEGNASRIITAYYPDANKLSEDFRIRGDRILKCLVCKADIMNESKSTYFTQLENCYVIIDNVPCMKCGQCGEVVYSASVMEKIDDILEKVKDIASKIFIMDYEKAA